MSNKTKLQSNNASLEECIARINAAKEVAAELPEAGGSSGGESVETCAVNVETSGKATIYYVSSGKCMEESIYGAKTLSVTKNTILFINGGWTSFSSESGNCEKLYYYQGTALYAIYGSCTLNGAIGPTDPI